MHRDLYLDTADRSLWQRGITCRLRLGADDRHRLSLRIDGVPGAPPMRVDTRVRAADVGGALSEDTSVARRIRALVDPGLLQVRLDIEVQRITRVVDHDIFRRPRIELHFDSLTVRRGGVARPFHHLCGHLRRGSSASFVRIVQAFETQHDLEGQALDPRGYADLLARWARSDRHRQGTTALEEDQAPGLDRSAPGELLNPELSLIAFQRRVLAIAEDTATPLRERLRFLSIVTSNVDEFYMVRMGELRRDAGEDAQPRGRGEDGFTASERLAWVESEIASLLDAQNRCAKDCLSAAASLGVHLVKWGDLSSDERDGLRARCRDEINPGLTPLAMTLSPGHPLPHLPHLALSLAVVFRERPESRAHLAEFELPPDVPRLMPVPGRTGSVISIEELLRSNVDLLHLNATVESAHLFRVTRGGDLAIDEDGAEDLLEAMAEATERRPYNAAVRVEVERTMPAFVVDLVLESLRRDAAAVGMEPSVNAVQMIDGLLDLRCLVDLPLPVTPSLEYPALRARDPVAVDASMIETIRAADLLAHHPFDAFDATVVRFLREAATDPAVTAIKITLYRVGDPSAVVDTLLEAARSGKRVVAFVELKARFDEEHNIGWARALERAGGNVVYGLAGLKVHAKVALVVRREGEKLQRYVHVGTGNYNTRAGGQYTDLSLFSARAEITSDVADLFNELTASSRPPQGLTNGALVAPHQLLPALLMRIARETANARAGRPASITIKVNGLSDTEVVRALYDASEAGVKIDLVVRGICTLRPGLAGHSTNIRVVSVAGRFLEHSRIYRFANDGAPEWFIGSSDLRPRNLRRRVELLVPVTDGEHRRTLDRVLDLYLNDAGAWELHPDGSYHQRAGQGAVAQEALASTVGAGYDAADRVDSAEPGMRSA